MSADASDLTRIHKAAGERVAESARGKVPVLSGSLRGSIGIQATRTKAAVTAGKALPPYAGVIHFGWPRHNIESQPFLYDAIDDKRFEVVGLYETRIEDLVKKLDRETP